MSLYDILSKLSFGQLLTNFLHVSSLICRKFVNASIFDDSKVWKPKDSFWAMLVLNI